MKINILNKIYIVIGVCVICLAIYKTLLYKSWDRYYYDAKVTAPSSYPVHIRECYFLTADDDDYANVRTENVNNHTSKWGDDGDFLELFDKTRLPQKLVISYYSYR